MDGLVGVEGYSYQITWIHKVFGGIFDIVHRYRVHMMNQHFIMNFVSFNPQVTTIISEDDNVSNAFPLFRAVEHLIHVAIVTERFNTDFPYKSEIAISLFECFIGDQFFISSNNIRHCLLRDKPEKL